MKIKKSLAIAFALAITVSGTVLADTQNKESDRSVKNIEYMEEDFSLDNTSKIYLYRNKKYIEISKTDAKNLLREKKPEISGKSVTTGLVNYYDLNMREYYSKPVRVLQWFGNEGEEVQNQSISRDIDVRGHEGRFIDRRAINKSFGKNFALNKSYKNIDIDFNINHNKICSAYISSLKFKVEGRALCHGIGGGEFFRNEKFTAIYPSDKEDLIIFIVEKDL